jgi:hypothetical protein
VVFGAAALLRDPGMENDPVFNCTRTNKEGREGRNEDGKEGRKE